MSTTGGSMLGRLTGRLAATAKAPQQPPQQHQDSGAGLSRTMREQVLSVDLSGVVDALPSLHSGSSPQPSSQPQQAQPSHISLDSSSLGRSLLFSLSASATPEPFRRDADIAWTTAAPSAPPQPPTYYLPSSSKAQLSASSPPGAPFPSSSASYPTSESPSFSMNPPTGNGAYVLAAEVSLGHVR